MKRGAGKPCFDGDFFAVLVANERVFQQDLRHSLRDLIRSGFLAIVEQRVIGHPELFYEEGERFLRRVPSAAFEVGYIAGRETALPQRGL